MSRGTTATTAQEMTAQEAAEALSLSKQSIIRRVDNQRLDGYRDPVTGHYRVSRAAVERLRSERESLRRAALLAD